MKKVFFTVISILALFVFIFVVTERMSQKEVDYSQYLKKIWVVKEWNGEAYPYFLFFITKVENGSIEGKLSINEIAHPDFYYYSLEPSEYLGDLTGTVTNGVAECHYEDKRGNKGVVTLIFNDENEIEAKIIYTDKEEALKNDLIDSHYHFRPYSLADWEDFIPSKDNSFAVNLNSWENVMFVTGEFDHGAKKYPTAWLSNERGDILYALHAPFQTASKITAATIKDLNGDGLKDIAITAEFPEDHSIEPIEWVFYQMENGLFNDSNLDEYIYQRNEINFEDLEYINQKTYKKVIELCSDIDFKGDFKTVNLKEDSFYREQYLKMLKGDESYTNKLKEKEEYDLIEFDPRNIKEYTYYYFDMNFDKIPELIVFSNQMKYMDIFSFNLKTNRVELLDVEKAGSSFFLGNNKIGAWYGGIGLTYEFCEINGQGNRDSKIFFYSEGCLNTTTKQEEAVYLLGFGKGSSKVESFKALAKEMGEQLFEEDSIYFLRLSKGQYDQITNGFFKSRKQAEEGIEAVTYTFDELFGSEFNTSLSKQ